MDRVRIGVIGCGVIGAHHMQSAVELPQTELVAVADVMEDRARAAAEKWGAARVYTGAQQMLDDPEVDAVVLALPAGFRVGLAAEALQRGKHVLVEKPAALNTAELLEIAAASKAAPDRVLAFCSSRYQFMPHTKVTRDFIATGALGPIRSIHFRGMLPPGPPPTSPPPAWRVSRAQNGGGILVNWGIYEFDYFLGLTGWSLKPRNVLANFWPISPQFSNYVDPASDADEHVCAMITCDGGTVISYERGERVAGPSETIARIIGTKGSLSLAMFPQEGKKIIFHNSAQNKGVWDEVIWEGSEDWTPTRVGVLDDFANAILEHRPPQTGIAQALVMQQITDAIYKSADSGAPVSIDAV